MGSESSGDTLLNYCLAAVHEPKYGVPRTKTRVIKYGVPRTLVSPELHPGQQQALTDRYLTVVFNEPATDTVGQVVPLHITATTQTGLAGEMA